MKGSIKVIQIDITELEVDAIVNAANEHLRQGGGVCGAIFEKAGPVELAEECSRIGGCRTGSAAITPGFNLRAKHIIHAVGPVWRGGGDGEEELLYSAYHRSLSLARQHSCRSIAFPLISSGIYGYPKDLAWQVALRACDDFLKENPDWPCEITFAVLSGRSRQMGETAIAGLER